MGKSQRKTSKRYEKQQARIHRGRPLGGPGRPDYQRGRTKGEVKRWARPVHSGVVRDAAKKGIKEVVSKSGFTEPAKEWARKKKITLMSRGRVIR